MQRPLEDLPPLNPAHRQALDHQLATRWFENPARAFKIGFRKASQLPLHCCLQHTEQAALTFSNRDQILAALGITHEGRTLQSEDSFYYPLAAPVIDDSPYFAQWAMAWEPITAELPVPVKYDRTLIVEIGAGFYLLSLMFAPNRHAYGNPHALQWDRLTIRQGHEAFDLPLGITHDHEADRGNIARAGTLFSVARNAIAAINHDFPMAETVLAEGLRPFIDDARRPPHAESAPLRIVDIMSIK